VLALDQITDPHNVGAILRSAAAFAVRAVILPQQPQPVGDRVLAKAASGALEHVPLVPVRNLADALIALGERGFQRVGLDSEGEGTLEEARLASPLLLALGAEGKGLRERVRTYLRPRPAHRSAGAIKSLNVSNAAAIALSLGASKARVLRVEAAQALTRVGRCETRRCASDLMSGATLGRRPRRAQEIALHLGCIFASRASNLLGRLDAFGDGLHTEAAAEARDGAHDGEAYRPGARGRE